MSVDFEIKDSYNVDDLLRLITALRSPDGCPWDREQTHSSIKKNFIEETYEAVEAINKNDPAMLREELGDVLLQILLHCEMEREKGSFDFAAVVDELCKKLVVRHPHVFGEASAQSCEQALQNWDDVKRRTKGVKNHGDTLTAVPLELPALMRAQKVQKRASSAGFDWKSADGAFKKLPEEIDELKIALSSGDPSEIEDELGDLLFSCVNAARFCGCDAEEALTASTNKFIARFLIAEQLAAQRGIDMSVAPEEELDELWNEAKIKYAEKAENGGNLNEQN